MRRQKFALVTASCLLSLSLACTATHGAPGEGGEAGVGLAQGHVDEGAARLVWRTDIDAIEAGAKRSYPGGRFAGVDRILREDMSLIASAWRAAEPKAETEILRRLLAMGLSFDAKPSTRFVLNWETDANDVDFHIYDARGGHAYDSNKVLGSGGSLYADVTTGYGPECFTIPGSADAGPYTLRAHYYAMGPMGYGMGKLEVIEHDGRGHLAFTENPDVIMKDHAYVGLGVHDPHAPQSAVTKDPPAAPTGVGRIGQP